MNDSDDGGAMESKEITSDRTKSSWLGIAAIVLLLFVVVLIVIVVVFPSPISADNYLKIKLGMARADVDSLLGEPSSSEQLDEIPAMPFIGSAPNRDLVEYGSGEQRIRVVYVSQKVYRKYFVEMTEDPSQPKVLDTKGY